MTTREHCRFHDHMPLDYATILPFLVIWYRYAEPRLGIEAILV
jgi:hypothetical protein